MLETTMLINCCTPSNADHHILSHHQIAALYSKSQMKSLLGGSHAWQSMKTAILQAHLMFWIHQRNEKVVLAFRGPKHLG